MASKMANTNAANHPIRTRHGSGNEHAAKHHAELKRPDKTKHAQRQNGVAENYVDRLGKIWHFVGKAQDGEELRQLCQQNWLTKSTTSELTIQFVCLRCARHRCKFRGIYVKKNGTLFVRGQHDHPLVKRRCTIKPDNNYVDIYGKEWRFIAKIANKQKLKHFCRQNWLQQRGRSKNRLFYVCKTCNDGKKGPRSCKLHALFNRENNCLYFRGNRNHPMPVMNHREGEDGEEEREEEEVEDEESEVMDEEEMEDEIGDDAMSIQGIGSNYVDRCGKEWRFIAKFVDERTLSRFRWQNWLQKYNESTNRFFYRCKYAYNGQNQPPYCNMRAVFNKQNSCIYFINEHNHPMPAGINDQEEKEEELEDEEEEEGNGEEEEDDTNLSEDDMNGGDDGEEPDYMDRKGRVWHFSARFKNEQPLAKFCQENCLVLRNSYKKTDHFICKWSASSSKNRHDCKFRALHVKKEECVYTRNTHNHPIH